MKYLFTVLLIAQFSLLSAQVESNAGTLFYNAEWEQISNRDEDGYYRVFNEAENGLIQVTTYYSETGSIYVEGAAFSINPIKYHGTVKFYHKNGNLKVSKYYNKGELLGPQIDYYENGNKKRYIFNGDTIRVIQAWNENEEALLKNGNGVIKYSIEDGYSYELVKDSLITESWIYRASKQDTIYQLTDKPATYHQGMTAFYKKIGQKMYYPVSARRRGIQGTVFVSFIIDKDGSVSEVAVEKGIGEACNAEAMRAVKKIKGWKPAYYNGSPVKTRMILPLIFRLH